MSSYIMMTRFSPISGTKSRNVRACIRRGKYQLTPQKRSYSSNKVYESGLHAYVLISCKRCLVVGLRIWLIETCRCRWWWYCRPSNCGKEKMSRNLKSEKCARHVLLARNRSSLRTAIAFMSKSPTYKMVPRVNIMMTTLPGVQKTI